MSSTPKPLSQDQHARHRGRVIGFLNWGHLLDHYVLLIYPTVVLGLEAVYNRPYGDLLMLSTAAFTVFGLLALPFGWIADHWSRRNMIAIYFFGTGAAAAWGSRQVYRARHRAVRLSACSQRSIIR